jgi:hypothetical protein
VPAISATGSITSVIEKLHARRCWKGFILKDTLVSGGQPLFHFQQVVCTGEKGHI